MVASKPGGTLTDPHDTGVVVCVTMLDTIWIQKLDGGVEAAHVGTTRLASDCSSRIRILLKYIDIDIVQRRREQLSPRRMNGNL